MIRAFLGLDLPEEVRSALAVEQFLLPLPRKVDPGQMHLTLVFLGEVPDRKGLWLAAGAGDLDAALAPALALVLIRQIFGKPDPLISRYLGAERFALRDPFGRAKATE